MNTTLKAVIRQLIEDKQGCKATEIPVLLLNFLDGADIDIKDWSASSWSKIPALIEELVSEGALVEVEYVLPSIDYRAKSFLLPRGTSVHVNALPVLEE